MQKINLSTLGYSNDRFAVILDNIFTEKECLDMINMTETVGKYELTQINANYGQQMTNISIRNNSRNLIFDNIVRNL